MPSTLVLRREHDFRPMVYTAHHREVVRLYVLGFRQAEIARWLHLSRSHVSRIINMAEAQHDAAELEDQIKRTLIARVVDDTFDLTDLHHKVASWAL